MNYQVTLPDGVTIRPACREDAECITAFIERMAEYERMTDQCFATPESIEHTLFDEGAAEVVFAMKDGREVGFALFYPNFSTFESRLGIHLEELFVLEEYRGYGIGKALLEYVGACAYERGCKRLEWWCLDWNKPSREFYEAQGARPQSEWVIYRMDAQTLAQKFGQ